MSSGFYEGGYSGYGGGGGGGTNAGGSGGYNNNYNAGGGGGGGGSSAAFSGSMGSSSMSYPPTQPMQGSAADHSAAPTSSSQHQSQQAASSFNNAMDGAFNLFNPALGTIASAAATGKMGDVNSQMMMNVAETMAGDLFEKGWVKAVPGLERTMLGLRPYFAVDNSYVKRKMTKILFPFAFREWLREEVAPHADGSPNYAPPQQDENAPDLYIPAMSLLTYVLLSALCYGNAGQFDPEVLPDVTSKCVVTQIMEVIAIRIGFYLMDAPVAMLDLFSYTGYKYLGLSVNLLSGITMGHFLGYGHRSYYFTYLWTATAVSYFILKVMANCIPRKTSAAGPKRQFMVLGFAGSQFATCWFVSQTKFLD